MTRAHARDLSGPSVSEAWHPMFMPDSPPTANWPMPSLDVPEIDRCVLESRPVASGMARDFVHKTLLRSGLQTLVDDTQMAVSELVTNALTHGMAPETTSTGTRQPIQLVLVRHRHRLLVTVTDPSSRPPIARDPGPLAEGGRGLQVLQALSLSWGWAPLTTGGKAVWAMFAI